MYFLVLKSCVSVSNVINQGVYGQDFIRSKESSRLFIFAVFRMTVVNLVYGITYASLQILVSIMLCVHLCALLQLEKLLYILQMITFLSFFWWRGSMTSKAVWSRVQFCCWSLHPSDMDRWGCVTNCRSLEDICFEK
jgi:hypothetical protein